LQRLELETIGGDDGLFVLDVDGVLLDLEIVVEAGVDGNLVGGVDEENGHGAPVAPWKGFVKDKGDAEAQGAGEQKPIPIPEDGGQDHFFIEALAAMKASLSGMIIWVHVMSLF
jgi:hypothetical protein